MDATPSTQHRSAWDLLAVKSGWIVLWMILAAVYITGVAMTSNLLWAVDLVRDFIDGFRLGLADWLGR